MSFEDQLMTIDNEPLYYSEETYQYLNEQALYEIRQQYEKDRKLEEW